MSLALYPHFGLHLLFSAPPKSGDNGCYTGKEETGMSERESGANRRRLRSDVLNYADFMSILQTRLSESPSARYLGSVPLGSVEKSSFLVWGNRTVITRSHLTQGTCKNLSLSWTHQLLLYNRAPAAAILCHEIHLVGKDNNINNNWTKSTKCCRAG